MHSFGTNPVTNLRVNCRRYLVVSCSALSYSHAHCEHMLLSIHLGTSKPQIPVECRLEQSLLWALLDLSSDMF